MNKKEAEELLNDFIEYGWKPEVHYIHEKIKDSFIKERFSKVENLPISGVSESNCEHPTNQTEDAEHGEWYYCHKCKSYFR